MPTNKSVRVLTLSLVLLGAYLIFPNISLQKKSRVTSHTDNKSVSIKTKSSSEIVELPLQPTALAYKSDHWLTVIDGDLYADNINFHAPSSLLGNFSPNIINSGGYGGGFVFSGSTVSATGTNGGGISEQGGSVERLNAAEHDFSDGWLNRLSFDIPNWANTNVPTDGIFMEGHIYNLSVEEMNAVIADGTYTVSGVYGEPGLAIVYVMGAGTISILNNFETTDISKLLVLVTDVPLVIGPDLGLDDLDNYNVSSPSQIDVGVISGASIKLNSKYDEETAIVDSPLIINGFLITRSELSFARNLGSEANATYPSVAVKKYPYAGVLIQQYDEALSLQDRSTGLSTMDIQYIYE